MNHFPRAVHLGAAGLLLALAGGTILAQMAGSARQSGMNRPAMGGTQRTSGYGTGYGTGRASSTGSAGYGAAGYGGAQGAGYGGAQGYVPGNGYGLSNVGASAEDPNAAPPAGADDHKAARLLAAAGLPTDNGHLHWPPVLLALSTPDTPEYDLREQIDALFDEAASQAAQGPLNPNLVSEMAAAVDRLHRRVDTNRPERFALPRADNREAERFLDKLQRATRVLAAGLGAPGAERQMATQGSTPQVALADDYLSPEMVTVPVGASVVWTNNGQHRHTVTADDERWSSLPLGPGDTYRHTFTEPGTYPYHCSFHPNHMRGTIVVK
jgi:plastocyanin